MMERIYAVDDIKKLLFKRRRLILIDRSDLASTLENFSSRDSRDPFGEVFKSKTKMRIAMTKTVNALNLWI